ncbi:MAG: preprotein translocase subunit SecA [Deltaproteobacteria bacterium]|nr:preprotein translocase subunit SecA [Deltaproteobacteria bacterium]
MQLASWTARGVLDSTPAVNPLSMLKRLFGTRSQREQERARAMAGRVLRLVPQLNKESEAALRDRAAALRVRARSGEPLDRLLVETFAVVFEAARRTIGLTPFPSQVMGAAALHRGVVVEMKTGEGKTLTATMPVALNALAGKGVHVVTVNDYLASRDAETMGPIYRFMGLGVAAVTEEMDPDEPTERKQAYAADVTYVTNHELVFDYLRDNLAMSLEEQVLLHRPLHFALVDEVDFLLLDEARTPLIISDPTGDEPGLCLQARDIVARLQPGRHFKVDHRARQVSPTESGWTAMQRAAGVSNLASDSSREWQHALYNALLARAVYERDVDYIVDEDKVVLVDEFTGRISPDKRMADGLHQALEAKEDVEVRPEDRTLAKTSYQNYFRLYPRLAGMTGTAWTAREELVNVYGLQVVVVPTHEPMIRIDHQPVVYRSLEEKHAALVGEIERLHAAGRPVLVGSTSVKESEQLSARLDERSLIHAMLNAKNHRKEAAVIAQAGRSGAVTISTNMAGRGVDIMLGGLPDADRDATACAEDRALVRAAGGLAVLGTGLHESRRIDDQLRGRSGRQGDPGSSRFFLSLDDPIYRQFGETEHRLQTGPEPPLLTRLRARLVAHPPGQPVRDRSVLEALRQLQRKVEVESEAIRKDVLKYDLVIEEQRQQVFAWRVELLGDTRAAATRLDELAASAAEAIVSRHLARERALDADGLTRLREEAAVRFGIDPTEGLADHETAHPDRLVREVERRLDERLAVLRSELGAEELEELARQVLLSIIDARWTDHLGELERVDEGIGLRSYAELDPALEFRREASVLFDDLVECIHLEFLEALLTAQVVEDEVDEESGDPLGWLRESRSRRRALKR